MFRAKYSIMNEAILIKILKQDIEARFDLFNLWFSDVFRRVEGWNIGLKWVKQTKSSQIFEILSSTNFAW